jgi:hypothetical protein
MSRGSREPSVVFQAVLEEAKAELLLGAKKAAIFEHRGIRGDERAASLAKFFRERLPEKFGIGKGEAFDYKDQRTGQLDVIIYDRSSCVPLSAQKENLLLPSEALYAVIEVKSVVTQEELTKSYKAAAKVRALCPFKLPFVAPRQDGSSASDGRVRCMYVIFGYRSDLSNNEDWLEHENERLGCAASEANAPLDCVDRLIVLDRGMLRPSALAGKWVTRDDTSLFVDSYLHVVNFLNRESGRRKPIDWQLYGPRTSKRWTKLSATANH